MTGKRVIVTVNRTCVPELDDAFARLRMQGLDIDQVDSVLDITQITGWYDGEPSELDSVGVTAEPSGWMSELDGEEQT